MEKFVLYADDINIIVTTDIFDETIRIANTVLAEVGNWFGINHLTLNSKKAQFIIFHRKQQRLPVNF